MTEKPKTSRGKASKVTDGCCLDANILYYLNHFSYIDDPRTKKTIDFLLEDHDYVNSGWRCRAYPIDPNRVFPVNCYMGAAKVLKAFASISKEQRSENIETVLEKIVENVLENRIYQYLKTTEGSRKDKAGWKRFGFPLFYQSDVLEILDAITKLGIKDSRMDHAIKLILDSQQEGGFWLLKHTFNGKMWIDIEEKHKPSKWITFKALRILRGYYN